MRSFSYGWVGSKTLWIKVVAALMCFFLVTGLFPQQAFAQLGQNAGNYDVS